VGLGMEHSDHLKRKISSVDEILVTMMFQYLLIISGIIKLIVDQQN